MMPKNISLIQLTFSLALFALAASLFNISRYIPEILTTINNTVQHVDNISPEIDRIVDEVALVRAEVTLVREQLATQVPTVLTQVSATLPVIQQVIRESEHYSQQIPAILKQVALVEQNLASIEKQLPHIFKRIDNITVTTQNVVNEATLWRPHSTQYLAEIEQSKEYIPQYLTRAENIVISAKTIGSEASSGLVSGFLKGVVSLPFEVVSGLSGIVDSSSRSAKKLTAKDVALMQEKVILLLEHSSQLKVVWYNVESGNRGTITKGEKVTKYEKLCYHLTFENSFAKEKEVLTELMCRNDEGLWSVM
ncbi:hypothetical protein GCM10009111_12810 [Colwellia asteriadis]|uniref:Surface antigen domain-containing protein n=1 Tax=Colwellia asteriadis TaxID=517723 RepID=A0ABN1L5G5_9GAMM